MKNVDSINFNGHRALVRVDFNVPLDENNKITDFTRINAAVPTIKKILNDGGSAVLMSHLGRPKGTVNEKFSLKHLLEDLNKRFNGKVKFADDCIGDKAFELSGNLKGGELLLLENLRFHNEETSGDENFARKLAKHGDIYVNDAFGTAHRAHASTSIVAKSFDSKVCGYVMDAELSNAKKIFESAERPFTAIMGGAKISDKIQVIEKLLGVVDNLIIGGGMSYTFSKAKGGKIGNSLVENDKMDVANLLIEKAIENNVNLILPKDNICADDFSNDANQKISLAGQIPDGWEGLDIGPESIVEFSKVVLDSKTVMWNGPMGVFEFPNFAKGTIAIAEAVVKATENGGFSLIGGGDSASAINNLGFGEKVSFVSTGGGALLEYMEGKELPGVKALEE